MGGRTSSETFLNFPNCYIFVHKSIHKLDLISQDNWQPQVPMSYHPSQDRFRKTREPPLTFTSSAPHHVSREKSQPAVSMMLILKWHQPILILRFFALLSRYIYRYMQCNERKMLGSRFPNPGKCDNALRSKYPHPQQPQIHICEQLRRIFLLRGVDMPP